MSNIENNPGSEFEVPKEGLDEMLKESNAASDKDDSNGSDELLAGQTRQVENPFLDGDDEE